LAASFIWRRGLVALLNPPAINILDQYTIASAAGRAALAIPTVTSGVGVRADIAHLGRLVAV
jgi:hypothetical protein